VPHPRRSVTGVAPAAAFFDLDRTLIATSASIAMARPFHRAGLLSSRALVRSARSQLTYLRGGVGVAELDRMRAQLGVILAGWEVSEVTRIVGASLQQVITPAIHHDVVARLQEHRDRGDEVIVISTSGQEIVEPVALALGAHRAEGSRLEVREGRWTGVVTTYMHGIEKVRVAEATGYDLQQCWAYSDSATDLPLLEAVGHPVAVNPDGPLRCIALERGWEVLDPAPVRRQGPALPPVGARAGAAALALLLTPALLAAARRRRESPARQQRERRTS
jgi:HAD superfamily hydrolase (TIGR01490 family)